MKKLLSMLSIAVLSTSGIAPIVANKSYQSLSLQLKRQINNTELPIANVENWDLSTGAGYFKYLYYCLNYLEKKDLDSNRLIVSNWLVKNKDGKTTINGANWNDSLQKKWVGNKGIVDVPKITNKSKIELNHSKNVLANESDEEQTKNSSSYTHTESTGHSLTLGEKISAEIDIDAFIEDTKISAEISKSGTWTDVVTNTYTAPSDSVKIPPHSQIEVDYYFYQTVDKVDTVLYQNYNLDQIIYFWDHSDDFYKPNKISILINEIENFKNIDWIFNIPNGYLKKYDGNYFIKTLPISYQGIGTDYKSIDGPAKPYPEKN